MKTLQIRLPEEILKKVDTIIEKGFFRSRSHLLRDALIIYVNNFNYGGEIPYILGPFTPSEISLLKKEPNKQLEIPKNQIKIFQENIKNL